MLITTIRAMHAAEPANYIVLLVPGVAPAEPKFTWKALCFAIKDAVKAMIGRKRMKYSPEIVQALASSELISRVRVHFPEISVQHSAGLDEGLDKAVSELHLDAIHLAMRAPSPRPACAVIGYVPDYQHRHLPQLFPVREIAQRDKVFDQLISASDAIVTNARTVVEDIHRFTNGPLPFCKLYRSHPTSIQNGWQTGLNCWRATQ